MSQSKVNQKSYAVSRFGLVLEVDGSPIDVTSYVKNIEGGLPKMESTKEQRGAYNHPTHHVATRTVEPITIELGLSKANPIIQVVQDIVNSRRHKRLSGHIYHGDANHKSRFEQTFQRALITEIGFPALDAQGKDLAMLKLKLQPEMATFQNGGGQDLPHGVLQMQKAWQNNSFRLDLERNGAKLDCDFATKVEGLNITIGAKAVQRGNFLLPEYMPGQLKMPRLSVHVPLFRAGSLIDWFQAAGNTEAATKDGGGAGYEATGALTFLDPTTQKPLYHMTFEGVGPEQLTIVKSEGGSATLKTVKLDMYVTNMKLNQ